MSTFNCNEVLLYIKNRVKKLQKRKLLSYFLSYLFLTLLIIFAYIIFVILFDNIFYMTPIVCVIVRILIFVFILFTIFFFFKNTHTVWRFHSFVEKLERSYSDFNGRLFTATECDPGSTLYSSELLYANLLDVKRIIDILPEEPIITDIHRRLMHYVYPLVLFILLLFAISPDRFFTSFTRVLFAKKFYQTVFFISPGNDYVEKGGQVNIKLQSIFGRVASPVVFVNTERLKLKKDRDDSYILSIGNVEKDFTYHLEFSDTSSCVYTIKVIKRPAIANISFLLHYPSYTKEKDYLTTEFDIYALKGTRLKILGKSTEPLKKAWLVFSDSTLMTLNTDGKNFTGSFSLDTTTSFSIGLQNLQGFKNSERNVINIYTFDDEYPSIEIVRPDADINLPQDLKVDLTMNVRDDYGVLKVLFHYLWKNKNYTFPVAVGLNKKDTTINYTWNLISLPMFPGDTLRYYLEVFDNDIVSGPKSRKTKIYQIRYPTAEEIYKEVTSGEDNTQKSLQAEADKLEDIRRSFQKLENSLRESNKLSWEEKKRAMEIIEKEKNILENIEKTKKRTKDIMTLSQEEIKKALDRTINLLKKLEQEERLRRIAKEAEALKEQQKELNRKAKNSNSNELKNLSSQEAKIKESTASLLGEMKELSQEFTAADSLAKDVLKNASEVASKSLSQLDMTQKAMEGGQKSKSLSFGEKAEKSLSKMSGMLSAGVSNMLSQRNKKVKEKIKKLIYNIVLLSKRSERMMYDINNADFDENAFVARETGIKDGIWKVLTEVEDLRVKDPLLPMIVDKQLLNAHYSVELSTGNLSTHRQSGASFFMKKAMGALNKAALVLIESLQNMPGGGSGSMAQLLQQLQSLTAGQMQINNGTQALLPLDLSSGTIPAETQRKLERLSELQSSLAERLRRVKEGLEKEGGGNVLGDLGRIARQRSIHKQQFSKKRIAERPGKYVKREPPALPTDLGEKEGIRKDILKELQEKYPEEYRDLIKAYFDELLKEENPKK
ncbi:MAG: hypothetical protein B5M53_05645 [Candidatus Cloacimonas sp. 4484_209]|nr:MAG: hypothetical protein B5M53_05645 [Candidatus Cloacimonas sp. 4484_209]